MNNYYVNLKPEEYNAISRLTAISKCDGSFDIQYDVNNGDYFFDFEEQEMIAFETGLDWLSANIGIEGLAYPFLNRTEREHILAVYEKHYTDERVTEFIRETNLELENQKEN